MLFCTQQFLIFFLAVFTVYWLLPWRRARVWVLLAASYYFYASWNPELARLIFLTTVFDYLIARGMNSTTVRWKRRAQVVVSVLGNLGVLGYFKYANFFLDSLKAGLEAAGGSASFPVLTVVLPVGISFYTFEAISYTVDVYRRKIAAETRLDHFLLFILFFPHLVAGPIVRAADFLPQVRRHKKWSWPRLVVGGRLILLGLFKKMVIADRMALLVDPVYANPGAFDSGVIWLAAIAFAIQIYCDFSGYSDIALGTARLLGYKLSINFMLPFAAPNVSEFWRRWHVSLSNWIRDYIYIPLGGNRGSVVRASLNLLIAMTLCGLWHGANWTFVAWGAINGFYLIGHRLFRVATREMTGLHAALGSVPGTLLRVGLTFLAFTLGMVLFRAPNFDTAATVFRRLFVPSHGVGSPMSPVPFWILSGIVVVAHLVAVRPAVRVWWEQATPPVRGLSMGSLLFVILVLAPDLTATFIYFQF